VKMLQIIDVPVDVRLRHLRPGRLWLLFLSPGSWEIDVFESATLRRDCYAIDRLLRKLRPRRLSITHRMLKHCAASSVSSAKWIVSYGNRVFARESLEWPRPTPIAKEYRYNGESVQDKQWSVQTSGILSSEKPYELRVLVTPPFSSEREIALSSLSFKTLNQAWMNPVPRLARTAGCARWPLVEIGSGCAVGGELAKAVILAAKVKYKCGPTRSIVFAVGH
jgi:hypothetical protein